MTHDQPNKQQPKRFDSFLTVEPVNPWNQTLCIMNEKIMVEQSNTAAVFISYAGNAPEILALMFALCGIYRGYEVTESSRWYFHSQLQPCLRIALLALQDKYSSQVIKEIVSSCS
ncbi:hypothetical protein ACS8E9_18290 [Pseudomonas neustonica]|uniref:hypothetical protein n=1 Tax=Pseudomonas neustonica TaxID=2487346 RepID=UPI003F466ED1